MASKPRKKYPGELGKPTPRKLLLLPEWRELQGDKGAVKRWEDEHLALLIAKLLAHYRIPDDHPYAYLNLSIRLARDHVPAFQFSDGRGPGRPRSASFGWPRTQALPTPRKKRKPGRPATRSDNDDRELLLAVGHVFAELGLSGKRGDITKALEHLLKEDAKKRGESPAKRIREELDHYRRRYSEAKKKFPEIVPKFEE